MILCKYCGGMRAIKHKARDDGQGYTAKVYWYECQTCGSRTGDAEMLDFQQWKENANEMLRDKIKVISDDWNAGKINKNKAYFNVTISREEYERFKRSESMYCKDCKHYDVIVNEPHGNCKHGHIIDVSVICEWGEFPDVKGALYVSDAESYKAKAYVHEEYGCIHFEKR